MFLLQLQGKWLFNHYKTKASIKFSGKITNITICEIKSPLRPFSSHQIVTLTVVRIFCAPNSVEVRRREEIIRTPAIFMILYQSSSVGILAGNSLYFRETEIFTIFMYDFATCCSITTLPRRREYWMLHRGPGFLAVVWFGSSPPSPPPVSATDDTQEDREREATCWREKRGKGVGEELNHATARKPALP